jgi:hypothetical protein
MTRADRNRNPTAFTTFIAEQAGLILGTEYEEGDSFQDGDYTYYTAKLLTDPVETTIKVIDILGFYTSVPKIRWTYIAIPYRLWMSFTQQQKEYTIGWMYNQEGGTDMTSLFPGSPN